MDLQYSQKNICWSNDWTDDAETYSVTESDTIDLDYYGLTDDEIAAFNDIRKDIYYDTWLEYISGWD